VKLCRRGLFGDGGGGIADVVAGSGAVPTRGAAVVVPSAVDSVEGGCEPWGRALSSPPEATITAMIAPATATTARAARSRAFLTEPEATLAAA
jgi:hypothetical protein